MNYKTGMLIFVIIYIVLGIITIGGAYGANKSKYDTAMKVAFGFTMAFLIPACLVLTVYSFMDKCDYGN